jgi:hypothetical protein
MYHHCDFVLVQYSSLSTTGPGFEFTITNLCRELHEAKDMVGWLLLIGTPQRVRRIRGDIIFEYPLHEVTLHGREVQGS